MSAISLKSITGITSITTPSGVDNVFTVHTNDTTERFRVDQTGNLNIAGIISATRFDGPFTNLNVTGIATFAGSVSIGGTLTYEDVTNIDSVGIITARDNIKVGTGVTITPAGAGFFAGIVTATNFVKADGSTVGFSPDAQNNLFAGTDAGASLNSSSSNNVLLGQDAGDSITEGEYNVCIGLRAGQALTDVDKNVCIGNDAGRNFNAGDSVFIGWYAGAGAGSNGNVCIGHMAGSEANGNETAYGYSSGPTASYSGNTNVCMGFASGNGLRSSASRNTILGPGAGRNDSVGQVNINGSDNIILGSYSSLSSVSASNECVIGAVYGSSKAINHLRIPGIGCSISEGGAVITGIVTATSFSGSGANLTSLPTQITINNNSNGRILTGTGNANEVDAQASFFVSAGGDPKLTISGTGHAQLNLTNTSGSDHTGINFGDSADINAGMIQYSNSNNKMQFHTNGGEKMVIDSSGRVGINRTPALASSKLEVGGGDNYPLINVEASGATGGMGIGSGALKLYYGTSEKVLITSSGVTIEGTTDGVLNLDTTDSRGSFIRFQQGGATEAWVGCGQGLSLGGTTTLAFRSDADIRIRTGTSEKVTITTEGMFAAKGQAGNWVYGNHPANYTGFHQFSSSKNGDWMMQFRQEHHNGLGFVMRTANSGNNEAIALYRENTTTYGFKVYMNGNVQNSNNSYGSLSDVSLKENIVDANSQWDDIKAIKVRNFNLKSDADKVKMLGVVAQELETVSPKLVFEDKEGVKGVHYSVLYMKAIKALQEAMTRIETLEAEVTALKGS